MARVLGVFAVVDEASQYAAYWCQRIMQEASMAGHQVRDLSGVFVTEFGLLTAMEQYQPEFVVLAGHGGPSVWTGAGMQVVLEACRNDGMMAGSQCQFISCLTGISLCPSMVSKGAVAVQGYTAEFIWMIDGSGYPAGDVYAASFTRTLVEAARAILRGGTWQEFYSTFRRVSDEEIARWGNSSDPLAASVMMCLRSNRDSMVVSGAGSMEVPEGGGILIPALVAAAVIMR